MRSRIPIFPIALMLALLLPGSVATQEMTPAAGELVTPDPAECTVEPRSMESLLAISATPGVGTPPVRMQADPANPALNIPAGEPADSATVERVTDTIHEMVACENAGDLRRAHAFVSDNLLRAHEAQQPLTREERIAAFGGTPVSRPTEDFGSVRVGEVLVLPDGEVVAVWERHSRFGSMTFVSVLVQQGDRYVIDRHIDVVVEPSGTPPA